jgi:hypothetical protein
LKKITAKKYIFCSKFSNYFFLGVLKGHSSYV